jgi:hypothetical protein
MLRSEDPLAHRQQRRVLVAGGGRIPRLPGPVGDAAPNAKGALGPLFLVAGWFSARSLARKGASAFVRTRLLRLGVPLIAFIFLINGLASYLGEFGPGPR